MLQKFFVAGSYDQHSVRAAGSRGFYSLPMQDYEQREEIGLVLLIVTH